MTAYRRPAQNYSDRDNMAPDEAAEDNDPISLTAQIVAAYVSSSTVDPAGLSPLIKSVHQALTSADKANDFQAGAVSDGHGETAPEAGYYRTQPPRRATAKEIKDSIGHDYIICLEDGERMTMLKRYIAKRYQLTPEQYRQKWGLPHDYPMVAPAYAARRSALAKKFGLGHTAGAKKASPLFRTAMGGQKNQGRQHRTA